MKKPGAASVEPRGEATHLFLTLYVGSGGGASSQQRERKTAVDASVSLLRSHAWQMMVMNARGACAQFERCGCPGEDD